MRALAANGSFHVALLDGVTGSGKTEVYFEAIAKSFRRGKQSLILMPEIALTGQFSIALRGGSACGRWSGIPNWTPAPGNATGPRSPQARRRWVVGARSALFLPYANRIDHVDEEHDQAYKQDEGAHYHAREHGGGARAYRRYRSCWRRRHLRSKPKSCAQGPLSARGAAAGSAVSTCPISRRSICARSAGARPLHLAAARRAIRSRSSGGEQALLFSSPAATRRCIVAGPRASFSPARSVTPAGRSRFRQRLVWPSLWFLDAAFPHVCPHCAAEQSLVAVGPGSSAAGGSGPAFPDARTMVLSSDLITSIETMRTELNEIARGVDIHHRHPAGSEGATIFRGSPGRCGRC